MPFGFVFIFGTMVFACRESFLSFKSFPCRPLTSILCHIPRPCRSLRRRHLFFSEAEPGSCSFIYSVGFFCKLPAASSLQTPTISPISQSSTSHMRTSTSSETYLSRRRFVIVFGASFVARRRSALLSKVCYSLCSRQHPFALLFYSFCFRFIFAGFSAFVHFRIGSLLFNRTELPDSTAFRTAKGFRVRSKASLLPALSQADAHFLRILLRAAAQPHR